MLRTAVVALVLFSGACYVQAESSQIPSGDEAYAHEIQQWRATRVEALTAADGWLSLVGLEWLKPGANRIGSAADNDVVLPSAPPHLGTVTLAADGSLHLLLAAASTARIDGKVLHEAVLTDDMHVASGGQPTMVSFGTASFYAIDRDGRKGLRVKDSDAATRTHFHGIDYFPIDRSWRIVADWVPFHPAHVLEMGTEIGTIDKVVVPGKAVFSRDGHRHELLPYQQEPGGKLFFVIADRTSGKQTYGAARFLYAALPSHGLDRSGKVVLDFNQAYNPPCAFTPFATCPLAPPENRLDLSVTAGEKTYQGADH
ncbi:MAG: DUF1684 domain-containing protein [Rhodanobacter sp.]|nr:MAG: DUF1684 domain-containing protein [Rhodanobacter sp.]